LLLPLLRLARSGAHSRKGQFGELRLSQTLPGTQGSGFVTDPAELMKITLK
jgi:hypothetical protein